MKIKYGISCLNEFYFLVLDCHRKLYSCHLTVVWRVQLVEQELLGVSLAVSLGVSLWFLWGSYCSIVRFLCKCFVDHCHFPLFFWPLYSLSFDLLSTHWHFQTFPGPCKKSTLLVCTFILWIFHLSLDWDTKAFYLDGNMPKIDPETRFFVNCKLHSNSMLFKKNSSLYRDLTELHVFRVCNWDCKRFIFEYRSWLSAITILRL